MHTVTTTKHIHIYYQDLGVVNSLPEDKELAILTNVELIHRWYASPDQRPNVWIRQSGILATDAVVAAPIGNYALIVERLSGHYGLPFVGENGGVTNVPAV